MPPGLRPVAVFEPRMTILSSRRFGWTIGECGESPRCSPHRVLPPRLAEPLCAELRRPLRRLEVDVDQPEPVAEAVHPFEVVLRAPVEVPVHGHSLRRRPLQLLEAGAE